MPRLILLFLLLVGGCLISRAVHAQGQAAIILSDSAAQAARDDTAMAVQRLFRLQRHTSLRSLLLGTVLAGAATYSLATNHPETTYQRVSTVGLAAVGGYGLFQMVATAAQQWRYRARHEERLLGQLDQGQPLPRWVRRRLKPAYFGATPHAG